VSREDTNLTGVEKKLLRNLSHMTKKNGWGYKNIRTIASGVSVRLPPLERNSRKEARAYQPWKSTVSGKKKAKVLKQSWTKLPM